MRWGHVCLLFLLFLVPFFSLVSFDKSRELKGSHFLSEDNHKLDFESLLALACPLPIKNIGEYELDLLPGLGEKKVNQILSSKILLKRNFKKQPEKNLQLIKGIGPKTAKSISSFLLPKKTACHFFTPEQ